jgi:hypothetical protein
MSATTIKLDGELLARIESAKPPTQSVTAYVREVLRRDLERLTLREAAEEYRAFVSATPDEADWLCAWNDADLALAPKAGGTPGKGKP